MVHREMKKKNSPLNNEKKKGVYHNFWDIIKWVEVLWIQICESLNFFAAKYYAYLHKTILFYYNYYYV